jgi:hypothetical protein
MLLPSELTEFEIVGTFRVTNPVRVLALAEEMRRVATKRRELNLLGLTLWEAIERALRRKGGDDRQGPGGSFPVVADRPSCRPN